jgi:pyruvate formate lyase activating enzyme
MNVRLNKQTLKVGGITPFSATDYPGKLAVVVFVQGCPWRCGYCHNPHLQARTTNSPLDWPQLLNFLRSRVGLVDAVVFSGGEPTIDPALHSAITEVRQLGFLVGLHTACVYPYRLREILPTLDWIGFDIKIAFERYAEITNVATSGRSVLACLKLIIDSRITHECRTTIHPALHTENEILRLAQELAQLGVNNYVLQVVRAQGGDRNTFKNIVRASYPHQQLLEKMSRLFTQFSVRRTD